MLWFYRPQGTERPPLQAARVLPAHPPSEGEEWCGKGEQNRQLAQGGSRFGVTWCQAAPLADRWWVTQQLPCEGIVFSVALGALDEDPPLKTGKV